MLACYVNSLFQAYFMSQRFMSYILHFNPNIKLDGEENKGPWCSVYIVYYQQLSNLILYVVKI